MIRITVYCPFCDKEIFNPTKYEVDAEKELVLHIIEHHHITEKKYYDIRNALKLKHSMNKICADMREAIREFVKRLETFERNESHNFFEDSVEWGSGDTELREIL